jgi:hypothetical protein
MRRWTLILLRYSAAVLFGYLVLQPLAGSITDFLRAKPDVVVNITEVHQIRDEQMTPMQGKLVFLFGTARGVGTLALIDAGNVGLNRKYGTSISAIHCFNCTEYGVDVGNVGRDRAENVEIDVRAVGGMELVPETKSPKLVTANCTGETSLDKGCHIEITSVDPQEPIAFSLLSKGLGLRGASCAVKYCKGCCQVNLEVMWKREFSQEEARRFRFDLSNVAGLPTEPSGLLPAPSTPGCEPIVNFREAPLPPINFAETPVFYEIDFMQRRWVRRP